MATRALLTVPARVRRDEPFEVRALISHPMETGHRVDADGRRVPREIIRRVECHLDGEVVFAADLWQAIAAYPYLAFWLRLQRGGTLVVDYRGDNGFTHTERAAIAVEG